MKFILPNMWCCHRSSLSGFMSFLFAFLGVALKKRCLLLLTSEQDPKNSKIHQGHRVVLFEMWANWHIGNKPAINKQFATNNLYSRFQTCNKRDLMAMCPFFFIICEVGQGEGYNLRLCYQLKILWFNHHVVYWKIATLNGLLLHLLDTYIIVYIPSSLHYWLANLKILVVQKSLNYHYLPFCENICVFPVPVIFQFFLRNPHEFFNASPRIAHAARHKIHAALPLRWDRPARGCRQHPNTIIELAKQYTLWLFNIAMENGPFIDGLSIYRWFTFIRYGILMYHLVI